MSNDNVTFDQAIQLRQLEGTRFTGAVADGWRGPNGANGGYSAALFAHAFERSTASPVPLRALSVHYLRPLGSQPFELAVTLDRAGRQLTNARATLYSEGRLAATATAILAAPRSGSYDPDATVASRAALAPKSLPRYLSDDAASRAAGALPAPFFRQIDVRLEHPGELFAGTDHARVTGWIRPLDGRAVDGAWLAFAVDAFPPAAFTAAREFFPAITVDLALHVRATDLSVPAGSFLRGRFESHLVQEGFWEEDGLIFAPDGTLLAQSRKLSLA